MKRMLAVLASLGLTATASLSVVACGKSNTQFNDFMSYVNETKGSYDNDGNPKTKSSASVIFFGAKDNASSLSFEYALSQAFGSLDVAKTTLNKERTVDKTKTYTILDKKIENKILTLAPDEVPDDLKNSNVIKVEFDQKVFDASINPDKNGNYQVTLENAAAGVSNTSDIRLTGYKVEPLSDDENSVFQSWSTAYSWWLRTKNSDRSIWDLDLNLDSSSKKFGHVSKMNKETPVYGIKGEQETGLESTAYDYAKIKLSLKTFMVDKVSDYWNSDLFKKIADDYLKKDLMYQLTASSPNLAEGDEDVSYQERQDKINEYLGKIKEAKGPLFLLIKNGHVIKIMKGWTRYQKFGNKNPGAENSYQDLLDWTNQISDVFKNSYVDNNSALFDIDNKDLAIKTWDFASGDNKDDNGASNWDPKKNEPTD